MQTTRTSPTEADATDLAAGTVVGEYRIDELIGRGGFGTVYRATHPLIGKQVAIKVLALKYSADPTVVSRFVAEAKAVNQIRHRNIIDIFAFGKLDDGRNYYVMEHLDGEPLDAHLAAHGPMPLAEALPILRAIARALDAAHAKGIAHRDLKPENIFLARDPDGGRYPKLLDFGIAKLLDPDEDVRHKTATGVPMGTPYYMSPEQCRGKDIDQRTDTYSFGIVVYRLLTAAYPFDGDDYMELMFKQVNGEAPPPSSHNPALPATVDAAVAWMMRKDRAQRPATIAEAVAALDPTSAVTPSIPPGRVSGPAIAKPAPTDPFAATTASAPQMRSRRPLWIGVVRVLVPAAAVVVFVVRPGGGEVAGERARTVQTMHVEPPPPPPASLVSVAVDAAPAPAPADVAIMIEGAPKNTEVFVGDLDRGQLGTPAVIRIAHGDADIELMLRAPGFPDVHRKIRPDHDQKIGVTFAKTPHHQGTPDSHDVIHVFEGH